MKTLRAHVQTPTGAGRALLASFCFMACGTHRLEPIEAESGGRAGGTAGGRAGASTGSEGGGGAAMGSPAGPIGGSALPPAGAAGAPDDSLAEGLVAYWKLDESSSTDGAADSAEGLHPAIAVGDPGSALAADDPDGVVGRSFDGQGQYFLIRNADALNFSGQITLAAWVKINALNSTCQYIVGHGYCFTPPGEVVLRIGSADCGPGVSSHDWAGGAWLQGSYSAGVPVDETQDLGVWLHWVTTYDGAAWRLYRNAVQVAQLDSVVGAVPVASDWAIGARAPGVPPCMPEPAERFLNGAIAEVRIYRRALSPSEVEELYHR